MWMASRGIDEGGISQTVANAISAFQWMADPDGISFTSWDVPHVCSNSWGLLSSHGYPDCDQTFWSYIDALEAAGCRGPATARPAARAAIATLSRELARKSCLLFMRQKKTMHTIK